MVNNLEEGWVLVGLKIQLKQKMDTDVLLVKIFVQIMKKTTVYSLSFLKVIALYVKQFFIKKNIDCLKKVIILEVEKEYRHQNIYRVENIKKEDISFLKIFKKEDFMSHRNISFLDFIKEFIQSIQSFNSILKLKNLTEYEQLEIISNGVSIISSYTYFSCFFRKIKENNFQFRIFSGGAILASYAVINNGIECNYLLHGLMYRPYSLDYFPKFNKIYLYSNIEKKWLLKRGISSKMILYDNKKVEKYTESIIIFLDNPRLLDYNNLFKIIDFFKKNNYSVYAKIHPVSIKNSYLPSALDRLIIIDSCGFEDGYISIDKIKPKFVASSFSTSLCESLNMGVIPILFYKDKNRFNRMKKNLIYPFNKKTISWNFEKNIISGLMLDQNYYNKTLSLLNNRN
jgi:hypothetical protein